MKIKFIKISFLASALVLSSRFSAWAYKYQANCNVKSFQAQNITSVMGEARNSSAAGKYLRFHAGVDIADPECGKNGNPVGAIYGGIVIATGTDVPGCINADCIRIKDSPNHAFDYIHVDWTRFISEGVHVNAGDIIGDISILYPLHPHLHLNDVNLVSGVWVKLNPQRPNALDYVDTQPPIPVPITVASPANSENSFTGALIPVQALTGTENAATTPVSPITQTTSDGSVVVSGPTDFLFSVSDSSSLRKGVYQAGLYVETSGLQPVQITYSGGSDIDFDEIKDADPFSGALDVFNYPLSPNSDVYFVTHQYQGTQASESNPVNFASYSPGSYVACAITVNNQVYGNINSQAASCIYLMVSGPPTIGLTQRGAPGTPLASTALGAQWFGPVVSNIVVNVPDLDFALSAPAGLGSLSVYDASGGLLYSSLLPGTTQLNWAVTATNSGARFPDGKGFSAIVTDVLGNATTGYFNFDATPPQINITDVDLGPIGNVSIPYPPILHEPGIPSNLSPCFAYPT